MDALKQLTLLIVEDQDFLRKNMEELLAPLFGKVLFAANGREALNIFVQNKPDLVLTGIIMSEMDGIMLTEYLRHISPETPVVFYCAFTDVPHLLRGIELGVAGFIRKPHEDGKMIATLQKAALPVLQKHQLLGLRRELLQLLEQVLNRGPHLKKIAEQVMHIARSDHAVLAQREIVLPSRRGSLSHDDLPFKMAEVEKWALKRALDAAGGKKMLAARLLEMNYYTFRRRLARYGMDESG